MTYLHEILKAALITFVFAVGIFITAFVILTGKGNEEIEKLVEEGG